MHFNISTFSCTEIWTLTVCGLEIDVKIEFIFVGQVQRNSIHIYVGHSSNSLVFTIISFKVE